MDKEMKKLMTSIKDGSLSPQEALDQYKTEYYPFTHVKDIDFKRTAVEVLDCGFERLNQHRVLKKGRAEIVVVGAGPGHGKTALMGQIAAYVARTHHVFFYSFEMDERDLKIRIGAQLSSINLDRFKDGLVPDHQLAKLDEDMSRLHLHMYSNGDNSIDFVDDSARRVAVKYPPALIVVDYLQYIEGGPAQGDVQRFNYYLKRLKRLAKDLKCPILLGGQLNRECERRGKQIGMETGFADYRPIAPDLLGTGGLERDADVLLFLSRHERYEPNVRPGICDVRIAKNRNGKQGDWEMRFESDYCRFSE